MGRWGVMDRAHGGHGGGVVALLSQKVQGWLYDGYVILSALQSRHERVPREILVPCARSVNLWWTRESAFFTLAHA